MDNPNYYAVIPATVRYDNSLSPGAKIFYGEISALSNKKNVCWASNRYFMDLYNCDERTIRRWLQELENGGHLEVKITPRKTGGGGRTRQICPVPRTKMSVTPDKNVPYPPKKIPDELAVEPRNDDTPQLNNVFNTKYNKGASEKIPQLPTFEEFMEAQGYHSDSLVDSDGQTFSWWEDEAGQKLKKAEVSRLKATWSKKPPTPRDTAFDDCERLVSVIKQNLSKQFGHEPIIGTETKTILRQNIIRKLPKAEITKYVRWYFVESDLSQKDKYDIRLFTSERMINRFLSQQ